MKKTVAIKRVLSGLCCLVLLGGSGVRVGFCQSSAAEFPFPHRGDSTVESHDLTPSEFDSLKAASDKGDGTAAYRIYWYFMTQAMKPGADRARLDAEAVSWLRRSAELGSADGQYTLAFLCVYSEGRIEEAGQWLKKLEAQLDASPSPELAKDVRWLRYGMERERSRRRAGQSLVLSGIPGARIASDQPSTQTASSQGSTHDQPKAVAGETGLYRMAGYGCRNGLHGMRRRLIDPHSMAESIRRDRYWAPSMAVRVMGDCLGGTTWSQILCEDLGSTVSAPNCAIRVDQDDNVTAHDGQWIESLPSRANPAEKIHTDSSESSGQVFAMVGDTAGNIIAAGEFSAMDAVPANNIARWDGAHWTALGNGLNGRVLALAVSGTDLYAAGHFTQAGAVAAAHVAKWNGSAWSALGSGMNGAVFALAASGNNLYAAGDFTTAGGASARYVARWNGSSWSALGEGMDEAVLALAVSRNGLYVGGDFAKAGGVPARHIARWDGSTWSCLGDGLGGRVNALAVHGDRLIAAGMFWGSTHGGDTCVAEWDGSRWAFPGRIPWIPQRGTVNALALLGSALHAGGSFTSADGVAVHGVAKWNGVRWFALEGGLSDPFEATVNAFAVNNKDTLYAGGLFQTGSEGRVRNIARWDGSAWSALGAGAASTTHTAEAPPAESAVRVPPGVVYKPASKETNDKAKAKLECAFSAPLSEEAVKSLFSGPVICGAFLWRQINDAPEMKTLKHSGRASVQIPQLSGGTIGEMVPAEAWRFQGTEDLTVLARVLCTKLKFQPPVTIRRLNTQELQVYWSMIPFDIEEPVFIVETQSYHLLVHLVKDDMSIFWMDDLKIVETMNVRPPVSSGATKAEAETVLDGIVLLQPEEVYERNIAAKVMADFTRRVASAIAGSGAEGNFALEVTLSSDKDPAYSLPGKSTMTQAQRTDRLDRLRKVAPVRSKSDELKFLIKFSIPQLPEPPV